PAASRILDAMGVLTSVERAGAAQLTGMRIRAPSGVTFEGHFAAAHGYRGFRDRGLALPRVEFDALVLDRAMASGARVRQGCHVTGLTHDVRGQVSGVDAIDAVHGRVAVD